MNREAKHLRLRYSVIISLSSLRKLPSEVRRVLVVAQIYSTLRLEPEMSDD